MGVLNEKRCKMLKNDGISDSHFDYYAEYVRKHEEILEKKIMESGAISEKLK